MLESIWLTARFALLLQEWKVGTSRTRISIPLTPWHWTNINTMRSVTSDAISPTSFPSPRLASSSGMAPCMETATSSWPLCVWALCNWKITFPLLSYTLTGASIDRTGRRRYTCVRQLRTLRWHWPFWKPAWSLCSSTLCGMSRLVSVARVTEDVCSLLRWVCQHSPNLVVIWPVAFSSIAENAFLCSYCITSKVRNTD